DSRSVDLDSLAEVAKEHGVSIRAKTGKRATGLTYALVDENGEVRRAGRSQFASTGTKLGAEYTCEEVLVSIQQLREAEKEIDDEQGNGEGGELSAAVARLAADGPRRGGAGAGHRGGVEGGRLGYLEAAIEALEKEMSARASTQDSTPPSELRSLVNMQREMNETLSAIGKTVSDERVVKTSGGETVTASQLSAHTLVSRLEK